MVPNSGSRSWNSELEHGMMKLTPDLESATSITTKIASEQPEKLRTMVKGEIWRHIVDPDAGTRNWNIEC